MTRLRRGKGVKQTQWRISKGYKQNFIGSRIPTDNTHCQIRYVSHYGFMDFLRSVGSLEKWKLSDSDRESKKGSESLN